MILVEFRYEPKSLNVNKNCLRVKNQENVKVLLKGVDLGNEA